MTVENGGLALAHQAAVRLMVSAPCRARRYATLGGRMSAHEAFLHESRYQYYRSCTHLYTPLRIACRSPCVRPILAPPEKMEKTGAICGGAIRKL